MAVADQVVVPLATPLPPRLLVQVTWVTPTVSAAVPAMPSDAVFVLKLGLVVGDVIAIVGATVSLMVRVTVKVAVLVLPAASRAVTVSTFDPVWSAMPVADQLVVPVALPPPPRLFAHDTWVTPTLSPAVPPRLNDAALVVCVALEVGEMIATVGSVVSVPMPLPVTIADTVLPPTEKITFVLTIVVFEGLKRTVTF
jgi:hypothetical protein